MVLLRLNAVIFLKYPARMITTKIFASRGCYKDTCSKTSKSSDKLQNLPTKVLKTVLKLLKTANAKIAAFHLGFCSNFNNSSL